MTTPDFNDEVTLTMKDGSIVRMRRADDGGVEICHSDTCLSLPATAPEFLALLEFMETFQAGQNATDS
ncbi:MAG: hypothetical protein U1B30_16025 [Pseudomonadota bacterium]|nr:hypothetical protein [Pseudomonadota bacterium]